MVFPQIDFQGMPPDFVKLIDSKALTDHVMGLWGWQIREHAQAPSQTLAESFVQRYNKRLQTLYVYPYVKGKKSTTGGFFHEYEAGFYGITLASDKDIEVKSRMQTRRDALSSMLKGTSMSGIEARKLSSTGKVIKGEGYGRTTLGNVMDKKTAKAYSDIADIRAFRIKTGEKNSKGRDKTKVVYTAMSWKKEDVEPMRFMVNGQWTNVYSYIANPHKYRGWIVRQNIGTIERQSVRDIVDTYTERKISEAMEKYNNGQ